MNSFTTKAFTLKSLLSEISLKVVGRGFHPTIGLAKESSSNDNDSKNHDKKPSVKVTDELRDAAEAAAKTLPGSWEATTEALLARLSQHSTAQPKPPADGVKSNESKSLLESM